MATEHPKSLTALQRHELYHEPNTEHLCMSGEFLMYVDQADCNFVQEAELLPTQLDDAVKNCEDTTTQIIRMDHKTWCGEDVTEDIANAWLNTHEPLPNAENILPAFVAESDAWQLYCDDFNTRFDDPKNER